MANVVCCQDSDLPAVRPLQGGEAPHVKRLQDVRRVWRHAEGNNLAFLAEILESERLVALVAIKN